MITAFAWVVIGDLVNMHMKIIYEKDLYAHNTLYTKTISKDKSSYKTYVKKINPINSVSEFVLSKSLIQCFLPVFEFRLSVEIYSNIISTYFSINNLRGPPLS